MPFCSVLFLKTAIKAAEFFEHLIILSRGLASSSPLSFCGSFPARLCQIGDSEGILLQDVSAFDGFACGGGFLGLFAAVHLPVGPVLHGQNILSRKGSRPRGHQGQKAYGLAPLFQLVHKLLRTLLLPVGVFQQDAELVAADAVTVTAAGVGFFDAMADLGQTDIPLCVAVAVVDLLEIVL